MGGDLRTVGGGRHARDAGAASGGARRSTHRHPLARTVYRQRDSVTYGRDNRHTHSADTGPESFGGTGDRDRLAIPIHRQ